MRDLGADRCADSVAHGSQAAGRDQGAGLCIGIILGRPHLVLSDIGGDDRVSFRQLVQLLDDSGTGELLVVIVERIGSLELRSIFEPVRMRLLGEFLVDLLEHLFEVADHREIHFDILVDLGGVYIDMQDLCAGGKSPGISDDAVRETGAQGDQKVTAAHAQVGGLGPVHTDHARIAGIGPVESTLAHECVADRSVDLFDKGLQLFGSAGDHSAAAYHDKGLFGGIDHADDLIDLCLGDRALFDRQIPVRNNRLIFAFRARNILGDVDQDRAGTACSGNCKGIADGLGQVVDVLDDPAVLGHRHGDSVDIDLLEGVLAQKGQGHVAGDRDHGDTVHVCSGDTGDQIGRAGAAGGEAYAHLSGGARIAVRRVGGALLMGCQIMIDLVSLFIKCVIYIQDRTAGISEHCIHTLLEQAFDDDIRTC